MLRVIFILIVGASLSACIYMSDAGKVEDTPQQEISTTEATHEDSVTVPRMGIEDRFASIATASRIFPHNWSPGSEALAYWTFSEEESEQFTYPPGTLHFFDINTGQTCAYPEQVDYSYDNSPIVWLPDGKIIAITGDVAVGDGQVRISTLCNDDFEMLTEQFPVPITGIAAHNASYTQIVLNSSRGILLYNYDTQSNIQIDEAVQGSQRAGYSWSPSNELLAISDVVAMPSYFEMVTYVVNTQTGLVEDSVEWRAFDAEGSFEGPVWLGEKQFLIQNTLDQGPLLVTTGEEVQQLIPDVFDDKDVSDLSNVQTVARNISGSESYSIAFVNVGATLTLYHSKLEETEELPFQRLLSWSPDGKWLILSGSTSTERSSGVYLREVNPESEAKLLFNGEKAPEAVVWKPDLSGVAVAFPQKAAFVSIPDGTQSDLGVSAAGEVLPSSLMWSSNGEYLIARQVGSGKETLVVTAP